MFTLTETRKKSSVYSLYKDNVLVKDSFNIEVIKKFLGRRFKKIYESRKILIIK
jgi:hypothetical protein